MTDVTIVDGYVDEPAHFGVPPYLSTYPRYAAGALVEAGVERDAITYHTIDALRDERQHWGDVAEADLVVYVGGMTVPGQYVGGTPAGPEEAREVAWTADGTTLMGGPVRFGVGETEGRTETERDDLDFDYVAGADVGAAAHDLVENDLGGFEHRYRDLSEASRWAQAGAFVVEQHPNHPDYLICEIETGRGCAYRCSFCTEPLYGDATFRDATAIVDEVAALADHGVRHFRLGRQADLLAFDHGRRPNPDAIERLYRGIREAVPDLQTLHLDNINPRTIVEFPDRARRALATIAEYNTAGDTAAFGLESADPHVREENELQVSADECFRAIETVNEVAGWRPETTDGTTRLPKLLPGINLVHGLKGEREATFAHNRRFLDRVLESGLMVRRINIRQVMTFEGTEMAEVGTDLADAHADRFQSYKRDIRESIDRPMLERVAPAGTVLEDVHLEYHENGRTFGRQLGTYPLLVAIPGERELGATVDVAITDHGFRSVTGVPYPLAVNRASMTDLQALPGVGADRAGDVVVDRPYDSTAELPVDLDPFVTVE
ncbi:MAG: radical SAM protein [Halococcoides sp.]